MRIKNPHHTKPIDAVINALKGKIGAHLQANSNKEVLTIEELRAAFPDDADQLTEGMLAEVCQRLGIEVIQ